jgi:hypothetical protein
MPLDAPAFLPAEWGGRGMGGRREKAGCCSGERSAMRCTVNDSCAGMTAGASSEHERSHH